MVISTSGFSLQVYKVNICRSEKRILPLQTWNNMTHALNVDKCRSFEWYSPQMSTEACGWPCSRIFNIADTHRK